MNQPIPAPPRAGAVCYIAGPMRGIPEFNFPRFQRCRPGPAPHRLGCMFVLPGWGGSTGAKLEVQAARAVGVPCYPLFGALHPDAPTAIPSQDLQGIAVESTHGVAPAQGYFAAGRSATEVRITSESGGQKGAKLARLGSLDPQALWTVAEVSGFGAQKYAAFNFLRGYAWSLSYDAMMRHLMLFWSGEEIDAESGLPHIAHAAWHTLALLAFTLRARGTDDRPHRVLAAHDREQIASQPLEDVEG